MKTKKNNCRKAQKFKDSHFPVLIYPTDSHSSTGAAQGHEGRIQRPYHKDHCQEIPFPCHNKLR